MEREAGKSIPRRTMQRLKSFLLEKINPIKRRILTRRRSKRLADTLAQRKAAHVASFKPTAPKSPNAAVQHLRFFVIIAEKSWVLPQIGSNARMCHHDPGSLYLRQGIVG